MFVFAVIADYHAPRFALPVAAAQQHGPAAVDFGLYLVEETIRPLPSIEDLLVGRFAGEVGVVPGDPGPGDVTVSDPAEDGSSAHPFDAIQEAVDRAYDTDSVIVGDGTYQGVGNRDINLLGRQITLRSVNGPAKTVVDCQATAQNQHRGFTFDHGETANTVVSGFTVTGGNQTSGGGIYCSGASPKLENLIISNNKASNGSGGGICCIANSAPQIAGCRISGNSAVPSSGGVAPARHMVDRHR